MAFAYAQATWDVVRRIDDLSQTEALVMHALADDARHGRDVASPGHETLMTSAKVSKTALGDALKRLRDRGLASFSSARAGTVGPSTSSRGSRRLCGPGVSRQQLRRSRHSGSSPAPPPRRMLPLHPRMVPARRDPPRRPLPRKTTPRVRAGSARRSQRRRGVTRGRHQRCSLTTR